MLEIFRGQKKTSVAAAGIIKAAPGRLVRIIVTVAGSAGALTIHDNASAASGTLLFSVVGTAALGSIYELDIPATAGLYFTPGTGQTCIIVYT